MSPRLCCWCMRNRPTLERGWVVREHGLTEESIVMSLSEAMAHVVSVCCILPVSTYVENDSEKAAYVENVV